MAHFPPLLRELPKFEGPFDAYKLAAQGCDVLFASYPAGTSIAAHRHDTENAGVITQGELILTLGGEEKRYGPGDWYHVPARAEHAARFEKETSEIELCFTGHKGFAMSHNPVGWFEIYVDDMQRARAFYEKVFGVTLSKLDGTDVELWAFPMNQGGMGCTGALVQMQGFPAGANSVIVYFICDDCAVEADKAAKAGGKIVKPKFSIGQYGHISHVTDTEGNMIGLHSMK